MMLKQNARYGIGLSKTITGKVQFGIDGHWERPYGPRP